MHGLPNEIVLQILAYLQKEDLYCLLHVSRLFFQLIIPSYLAKHGVKGYTSGKLTFLFNDHSMDALKGLCVAPYFSHLRHLECRFSLGGLKSLEHLQLAIQFVRYSDAIEEVTADVVPAIPLTPAYLTVQSNNEAVLQFENQFREFLEVIIKKSCKKFTFQHGAGQRVFGHYADSWRQPLIPDHPKSSNSVWRFVRSLGAILWHTVPQPMSPKGSSIESVQISSSVLFTEVFYDWTTSILASPNVIYLQLDCSLSSKHWSTIFSCVCVPRLTTLILVSSTILPPDLSRFLDRHHNIVNLDLRTGSMVKYDRFPPLSNTALPRLYSLKGNPRDIEYILKGPNQFMSLRRVTILARLIHTGYIPVYHLFPAMSRLPGPISLSLVFNGPPGLQQWLNFSWSQGAESPLQYVKALELDPGQFYDFSIAVISLFPTWLARFPALENVTILSGTLSKMNGNLIESFRKEMVDCCRHLRTLMVNSKLLWSS